MTKDFVIVSVCIVGLINTSQSSFILFFHRIQQQKDKRNSLNGTGWRASHQKSAFQEYTHYCNYSIIARKGWMACYSAIRCKI